MFSDVIFVSYWWLAIFGIGIVFLPMTIRVFSRFWDLGYSFSKILGLAILSFLAYLSSFLHILPFYTESLFLLLLLMFAINWLPLVQNRHRYTVFKTLLSSKKAILLGQEMLFFVALLVWAWVRGFAPDIEGLEKFMDWGFINSILRTKWMPPKDMWFAGGFINYYYFGHFVNALLTKLTLISSTITYNLGMATMFAFTLTLGFSLGSNLVHFLLTGSKYITTGTKRVVISGGIITALLLTLGGNLHTVYKLARTWHENGSLPAAISTYWYPDATRFIGFDPDVPDKTIHEFPLYSFVVSDLHGHVNDIPFVLLFTALLLAFLPKNTTEPYLALKTPKKLLLLGLLLAIMYMTNAWDFAIYGLLFAVSVAFIFLRSYFYDQQHTVRQFWAKGIQEVIFPGIALVFLWFIFTLPFSLNFTPMAEGLRLSDAHSPFYQLVILHGGFWLVSLPFLILLLFWLATRAIQRIKSTDLLCLAFISLATLLVVIPEIGYLKDIYIYDHRRANTMFKLVYQSFILYSLVSGYLVIRVNRFLKQKRHVFLLVCVNFLFLCVFVSHLSYPYFAIKSYYGSLQNYSGLYGLNFLRTRYPENLEIINWLNTNVKDQPVILEAVGDSYTDYNQVSMATGLPTIEGWTVHEWLWRGGWDEPGARQEEVRQIYEAESSATALPLVQKYQVQYIIVGAKEREKYPNLNEEMLTQFTRPVFVSGQTTLYKTLID